jgi:hypothetical protein
MGFLMLNVDPRMSYGPQTLWTNGTRRSYGVLSYPSRAIHGQPQKYSVPLLILGLPLTYFPLLRLPLDRMQAFYRGRRDRKVRGRGPPLCSSAHRSNRESDVSHSSHFLFFPRFGWFWQCPNGELCQYRHALPPGFVLKSQKKAMEEAEKANTISLEEFLEVEVRHPYHNL